MSSPAQLTETAFETAIEQDYDAIHLAFENIKLKHRADLGAKDVDHITLFPYQRGHRSQPNLCLAWAFGLDRCAVFVAAP